MEMAFKKTIRLLRSVAEAMFDGDRLTALKTAEAARDCLHPCDHGTAVTMPEVHPIVCCCLKNCESAITAFSDGNRNQDDAIAQTMLLNRHLISGIVDALRKHTVMRYSHIITNTVPRIVDNDIDLDDLCQFLHEAEETPRDGQPWLYTYTENVLRNNDKAFFDLLENADNAETEEEVPIQLLIDGISNLASLIQELQEGNVDMSDADREDALSLTLKASLRQKEIVTSYVWPDKTPYMPDDGSMPLDIYSWDYLYG